MTLIITFNQKNARQGSSSQLSLEIIAQHLRDAQYRIRMKKLDFQFLIIWKYNDIILPALRSKFNQNEDLKETILQTKTAKLIQYVRGSIPNIVSYNLMFIRKELLQSKKEKKVFSIIKKRKKKKV